MEPPQEPTPHHPSALTAHQPTSRLSQFTTLLRDRWPEYVLEVIVIMVSITLSLAVDEWKETNRKQEVEQQYLNGLASNLETDISQLGDVITETRQVMAKARILSSLTPQQVAGQADQLILNNIQFVFKRPRFVAEEATFLDLTSTGNMQLLQSYPLKSALFAYYKDYESLRQVETAELETTNALAAPYLLKRLPLGKGTGHSSVAVAQIVGEIEFSNMMLIRLSTREELLGDYEELLQQGNHIQAMLKRLIK